MFAGENPLEQYFYANTKRRIHKWLHYFEIYHRHLSRFQDSAATIVEIGVSQGGSLQMWRDYFGASARIYGVDIDPRCKQFEETNTHILIGDQGDRIFLGSLAEAVGPIDILIDDGGHTMGQQIATFEELYPKMREDGVYLAEDLHTSYWKNYGGGLRRSGTFIEYAKRLVDQLNAWHSRQPDFEVDSFTRSTKSVHFYDSVVVFERGRVEQPRAMRTGEASF